jgi:hypothetical protein
MRTEVEIENFPCQNAGQTREKQKKTKKENETSRDFL